MSGAERLIYLPLGGAGEVGMNWGIGLGYAFDAHWNGLLKLADYRADGFARDTRKLWVSVEYVY